MEDSPRRSGRKPKQNPRYVTDLVDDDDLDNVNVLSSDSGASEFEQNEDEENQDLDLDEELDEDINEEESSVASEDETTIIETYQDQNSRRNKTVSRINVFHVANSQDRAAGKTSGRRGRPRKIGSRAEAHRFRGIVFNTTIKNRHIAIHEIAGNDPLYVDTLKREQNKHIATKTLPYREHSDLGRSGLAYPEIYDESIRNAERQSFLHWYEENQGWQTMAKAQAEKPCAANDRALYVNADLPPQHILLGPYKAQHHFVLGCLDSISLTDAWQTAIAANADTNGHDTSASERSAWIINTGSRILSMDWAPSQDGAFQYLAVSVAKNKPTKLSATSLEPIDPYEASVQIWAFPSKSEGNKKLIDMNQKPRLVHVICAKWGSIRRISWCPAAISIAHQPTSIGILGLVSTDGFIRVLDVCVGEETYMVYDTAAFASKPPDTIFTCLTWLSASQLAAGCGNGYVAIWDIGKHMATRGSSEMDSTLAIPTWYHALHTTYVMSVIAHQPYPCQYITTNAVDGRVRLVSIRNPYADTAYGSRARQLMPPLCAAPHILGFYEIDDADGVRARSIRHIPFARSIGKISAQVTYIDAGKAHSCLLFGGSDGSVIITNPLPRIFLRRLANNKLAGSQQTWFKHEFVPSKRLQPTDYASSLQIDAEHRPFIHPRMGFVRFLESFRIEKISLNRASKDSNTGEAEVGQQLPTSQSQPSAATEEPGQNPNGYEEIQISIYEEEQAVTCLSWNANISAGGWAAAGMANGLLRVEDLAI